MVMLHQRLNFVPVVSRKNQPQLGHDLTCASWSDVSNSTDASTIRQRTISPPASPIAIRRAMRPSELRRRASEVARPGIEGEPIQVGSRRPGPLDDSPEDPRQSFP